LRRNKRMLCQAEVLPCFFLDTFYNIGNVMEKQEKC